MNSAVVQFNLKVKRFKCVNNKYIVSLIAKKNIIFTSVQFRTFLVSSIRTFTQLQNSNIFVASVSNQRVDRGGGVAILPNRRRLMLNAAQTPDLDVLASVIFLRRYFLGRYVRKDHKQCVTFSTGD